eukprot:403367589
MVNYTKRKDSSAGNLTFFYSAIGIKISGIDMPVGSGSYGPIVLKIFNNTDSTNRTAFIASHEFNFTVEPATLLDQGYVMDSQIYNPVSTTKETNTITIYFQTTKQIPQNAFVKVQIPDEIQIGNKFDTTNQDQLSSIYTQVPCSLVQNLENTMFCQQQLHIVTSGEYPNLVLEQPVQFSQSIYIQDAFLSEALYDEGIYSFKLYNISYEVPILERYYSEKPIIIQIFTKEGRLIESSDENEANNYIIFEPKQAMFNKYADLASCDQSGCADKTSDLEKDALVKFYQSLNGIFWRYNENWLDNDPCQNLWYGVICNRKGQIISLHFFENHLVGLFDESFANLKYLKHLTISNDGREHENVTNVHANTLFFWNNSIMSQLINLEEINMQHLDMFGHIETSITNLIKLKYFNLAYNKMTLELPVTDGWLNMKNLEQIELESNQFSGGLPPQWAQLQSLIYVDVSRNKFTGDILILNAAENIQAIEFSDNLFSGPFPSEYFKEDKFFKLEYVNANFNPSIIVPEKCIRYAFCFKSKKYDSSLQLILEMYLHGRDGNLMNYVDSDTVWILKNQSTNFTFPQSDL